MSDDKRCQALADLSDTFGPPCNAPATFQTTNMGYRCDACAARYREVCRKLAQLIAGREPTELEMNQIIWPLGSK